jgi:hypothetical protein
MLIAPRSHRSWLRLVFGVVAAYALVLQMLVAASALAARVTDPMGTLCLSASSSPSSLPDQPLAPDHDCCAAGLCHSGLALPAPVPAVQSRLTIGLDRPIARDAAAIGTVTRTANARGPPHIA